MFLQNLCCNAGIKEKSRPRVWGVIWIQRHVGGAPDRNRTYDNPASEAGALSPELQARVITFVIISDLEGKCKQFFWRITRSE